MAIYITECDQTLAFAYYEPHHLGIKNLYSHKKIFFFFKSVTEICAPSKKHYIKFKYPLKLILSLFDIIQ